MSCFFGVNATVVATGCGLRKERWLAWARLWPAIRSLGLFTKGRPPNHRGFRVSMSTSPNGRERPADRHKEFHSWTLSERAHTESKDISIFAACLIAAKSRTAPGRNPRLRETVDGSRAGDRRFGVQTGFRECDFFGSFARMSPVLRTAASKFNTSFRCTVWRSNREFSICCEILGWLFPISRRGPCCSSTAVTWRPRKSIGGYSPTRTGGACKARSIRSWSGCRFTTLTAVWDARSRSGEPSPRPGLDRSRGPIWKSRLLHRRRFQNGRSRAGDLLAFSAFLVHRSGTNSTESIRWSCHFRYNDLAEATFVERGYPHAYVIIPSTTC